MNRRVHSPNYLPLGYSILPAVMAHFETIDMEWLHILYMIKETEQGACHIMVSTAISICCQEVDSVYFQPPNQYGNFAVLLRKNHCRNFVATLLQISAKKLNVLTFCATPSFWPRPRKNNALFPVTWPTLKKEPTLKMFLFYFMHNACCFNLIKFLKKKIFPRRPTDPKLIYINQINIKF